MKKMLKPIVIAFSVTLLSLPTLASAADPMFRAKSGENLEGPMRTMSIAAPVGWRQVSKLNQDPLSLGQWTPSAPKCATGASSRLSVYAVDVGREGPHKLMQKWLPSALRFNVAPVEAGFVIVRAEADRGAANTVVAYPVSDETITPLAGWIGGVKIVFVAESTTMTLDELESVTRQAIRKRYPVRAKDVFNIDSPYVLFAKKWHKSLAERFEQATKKNKPNALVSRAYALFGESNAFVPAGQNFLQIAAENGHDLAKMDLIRLHRRGLMSVDISAETLSAWSSDLAKKGAEDAKFWATEARPFDEDEEKIPGLDSLKKLAQCGQPEARRLWAKKQVQSFNAKERYAGRMTVVNLMAEPPLEGTLPITTRVPRAVDAPAIEQLKAAAVLKTACPNEDDPDDSLFVKKGDFKVHKSFAKNKAATEAILTAPEAEEFPELNEAKKLDKLANAGDRKLLQQAVAMACRWSGGEEDRQQLVIELAARRDGLGKWRRFRACEIIQEPSMAGFCRAQVLKQTKLNLDTRFNDILIAAGLSSAEAPQIVVAAQGLRRKANEFFEKLLAKSYEQASSIPEKSELDETRRQMESEFMGLLAATLNKEDGMSLTSQMGDVVTGRRLLVMPAESADASFSLKRQAPSPKFIKKELERLDARLKETLLSIDEAAKEDISPEFKKGLREAHTAWLEYQKAYTSFANKIQETHPQAAGQTEAAQLWFFIEGVYYLEKIRDRQISRVVPDDADIEYGDIEDPIREISSDPEADDLPR